MRTIRETGIDKLLGLPLSIRDLAQGSGLEPPISLRDMLRSITIRHFPAVVTTPDPEALSGNVDLTIHADGRFELKVHMHDSGLPDYSFRLGIILRSQSGKSALAFYSRGVAHGSLSPFESADSDERRTGRLDIIRQEFDDFAAGTLTVVREYQNDLVAWIESAYLEIATFLIGCVTLGGAAALMIYNATYLAERFDVRLPGNMGQAGLILAEGASFLCGPAVFIPAFIAGAVVSEALFERRRLSADEIEEARTVFGDTIPYDNVWVTNLEGPSGRWLTTIGIDGSIIIGASSEFGDMVADETRRHYMIHEMTHVWQNARAPTLAIICDSVVLRTRELIEGMAAVYGFDRDGFTPWDSLNVEQQAAVIQQAYRERHARTDKNGNVISVAPEDRHLEHYIEENILTG